MVRGFGVEPKDIQNLNEKEFVEFLNKLIRAESQSTGLLSKNVYTTLRSSVADKGIDAKIENCNIHSQWICSGNSIWQFRTGSITEGKLITEIDDHPKVVEYVKNGFAYVFCNNKDYIVETQKKFIDAMVKRFIQFGVVNPTVIFHSSVALAEWAVSFPALARFSFFHKPDVGDLLTWKEWSGLSQFEQKYKADAYREVVKKEVCKYLNNDTDQLACRIEGNPGVGKTRLALECFRPEDMGSVNEDGAQDLVLYAFSMADLPSGLLASVKNNQVTKLYLVVDECSYDEHTSLLRYVELCQGRLKLLTIGCVDNRPRISSSGYYELKPFDFSAMQDFLRETYTRLPPEAFSFIGHFASGYVKAATALAEAMLANPGAVTIRELRSQPQVHEVLKKYIISDSSERIVMQGISLFTSLGWDNELADEGRVVMDFFGMSWLEARNVVHKYFNKGLVTKKGRYRYVTPYLLATLLAEEAWETYGDSFIHDLIYRLPNSRVRSAFLQRLSDLGDNERSRKVAETLINDENFPDIDAIKDDERAAILKVLAENSPQCGIEALNRIIGHLPRDQLLKFTTGRRHIVTLLRNIVWRSVTFIQAARLLMKLADAENEGFGNNATNEWVGLFQTYLGGTAVPAIERHTIINEALHDTSENIRLLAVQAIKVALSVGHEYRLGGAERQGGHLAEREWHPRTIDEDRKVRFSALRLLKLALNDTSEAVVGQAEKTILQVARGLVTLGIFDEVIKIIKNLELRVVNKREIRETLEGILKWEKQYLSESNVDTLTSLIDELQGVSLIDRLHRWAGRWTLFDHELSYAQKEREIENLVMELIENERILTHELDWLVSSEAVNGYLFGKYLGIHDEDHVWLDKLVDKAKERTGRILLSQYLYGHVLADRDKLRDAVLDDWVSQGKDKALLVFDTIRDGSLSDEDILRVIKLLEKEYLPPGKLSDFAWGGIVGKIKGEHLRRLLDVLVGSKTNGSSLHAVIQLLAQRLYGKPEEKSMFETVFIKLFERRNEIKNIDSILENDLAIIARMYTEKYPVQTAQIVLAIMEHGDRVFINSDRLIQQLFNVTEKAPREIWNLVSEKLMSHEEIGLALQEVLHGTYAPIVGEEILFDWVKKNETERPYILARITPVYGNPLNDIARKLIIDYGDDKDICSALYANFLEGSFSGSMVEHSKSQLSKAQEWMKDSNPSVCRWAKGLVDIIEREIESEQQYEEEMFL